MEKLEEFFDGTLGTLKTDPVAFRLKQNDKPICFWPYLVTKVHEKMFKNDVECLVLLGVIKNPNDS